MNQKREIQLAREDFKYQFNGAFVVCRTPKNIFPDRPYPVDALDAKDPIWECKYCGDLECSC